MLSFWANAQENVQVSYTNEPLTIVLSDMEQRYGINFSYNADIVKDKTITIEASYDAFSDFFLALEQKFAILFKKINATTYVIQRNEKIIFCGYVRETLTGRAIEAASISNIQSNKGTISNSEGYFLMEEIRSSDTLSINFIGYKNLQLTKKDFTSALCPTFFLQEENYELNEVIVKEYLAAGILKQRDGSVRITPSNLEILSGLSEPDVLQNVQLLPGIESTSETASGIFIRGGSPDQNLILWDGIKMYNSGHFFDMISVFNSYVVESVKVYRSSAGVQYGDRVSGVIDIATTSNIPEKVEGGFGLNLTHFDGFIHLPLSSKTGLQISARRSLTDIFETPTFRSFSNKVFQNTSINQNQQDFEPEFTEGRQQFYFYDTNFKINSKLSEKDGISFAGLLTSNQLDYSFADIQFNESSSDALVITNFGLNGTWKRHWTATFKSKLELYYSKYDFNYDGQRTSTNNTINSNSLKSNNIDEIGVSAHTDWQLNDRWSLSNGYQFFNNHIRYQLLNDEIDGFGDDKNPTHTVYNKLNYNSVKWYVDTGLRSSYYVNFYKVLFEPRLYVEYKSNTNFRVKASAEIRNQSISQILEFTTQDVGLENQIWAVSDRDAFPIIRSEQVSTGFLVQKNGWNLDMEVYYRNIDGQTSISSGFESVEGSFTEGESSTRGLDVILKKKINNYSTWLSYTYSKTDFTFGDLNAGKPFSGNNDITNSLTWSQSYAHKDFQFSMGWNFRTGIPYTKAGTRLENDVIEIEFETLNAQRLKNYHRLDVSAVYNSKRTEKENALGWTFGISLLNVYGRQNELRKEFSLFDVLDDEGNANIELRELTRFSLGFTPNLVFRLNF
jgi:outer membrane cobalamin receptor